MDYYRKSLKNVFENLHSSETGLTAEEAKTRLAQYGLNQLEELPTEPWWKLLLRQFNSIVIWILLVATIISFIAGEFLDATVILIILVLNSLLGFVQEYKAEKAIDALKKMTSLKAKVIRDGKTQEIDTTELVPGDIIILEEGEKIPADSRLIKIVNLQTQEATLTGESVPVKKEIVQYDEKLPLPEHKNMVFSGTIITKGKGKALVCRTGMKTEIGKIAHMIQHTETIQTPLQNQLAKFGKWLGVMTITVCVIIFLAGIFIKGGSTLYWLITAVALAVAAIPEGLPAVVTISLALGVQRMAKKNALMRHLPSVETLGCTTVICSDKTGTLTHNEMTVKHIFADHADLSIGGSGYNPKGNISEATGSMKLLLQIGALNNDAKLDRKSWKVIGDPTEGSLITSALKGGVDQEVLERQYPRIDEIPFDSQRKLMTTVHYIDGKNIAYVKGAPDLLIERCEYAWIKGKKTRMTNQMKKEILSQNDKYAEKALRVLGFAFKILDKKTNKDKKDNYEKELTFVGLQGMIDPPRAEAKDAISKCKTAGIKVMMVTGDFEKTAVAIAKELGITGRVVTGYELEADSDGNLDKIIGDVGIFARVNPEHKLRIVNALQKRGHIVAMTGDGVNDAPALKKANIGISMGITGTDVAKEAAEMILTDDNFASIVNAVEEGRGIYDNIRKFVNYMLSTNSGEVLIIFLGILIGFPLPLIAVQMLWINLLTDGLPAIALGVDPVDKNAMTRNPRKVSSRIMTKSMQWNIFTMGAMIAIAALFGFNWGRGINLETGRTIAFTSLVMLELVRLHMIRSTFNLGMFSNKKLIYAVLVSIGLQLLVLYSPLSMAFETVPLGLTAWEIIGVILVSTFLAGTVASKIIGVVAHEE